MRIWTHPEANEMLPVADALLQEGQRLLRRITELYENGDESLVAEAQEALERVMLRFEAIGIEVKDLQTGLIDFRTMLGDQEVYLCWLQGEEKITHWHTLQGGFARRRPIPDFSIEA